MDTLIPTKEQLWEQGWKLLLRAKADRKHPFHLPVFCTLSPTLHPRSRTLVLRNILREEAQLWCYTDRRSQKAKDIALNPSVAWTFWAPKPQMQVNITGEASWLPQNQARERFLSMPRHSRKAYATLSAPGQLQPTPESGLPEDWEQRSLSATDYAIEHFGVLVTRIKRMEILLLSRNGHLRLEGYPTEGKEWRLNWLIP